MVYLNLKAESLKTLKSELLDPQEEGQAGKGFRVFCRPLYISPCKGIQLIDSMDRGMHIREQRQHR